VTRIGVQFPRWSLLERKNSVSGRTTWTLIVAQSGEQNTELSRRRPLWGKIPTPLDARRIHRLIIPLPGALLSLALMALR
jgi:hypothetical protein